MGLTPSHWFVRSMGAELTEKSTQLDSKRHSVTIRVLNSNTKRHPMNQGECPCSELLNRACGFDSRRGHPCIQVDSCAWHKDR